MSRTLGLAVAAVVDVVAVRGLADATQNRPNPAQDLWAACHQP